MHTYEHPSWEGKIYHNGDYSGDVIIRDPWGEFELELPAAVLIGFAAAYVRDKKISRLEQAEDDELLGVGNK